ncbi:hypothetical protein [Klebsiella variicola]|uniref:hypothetical protein n=1 Tax=Klebsiella variicola TaxID=244366 RepID=UPI000E2AFB6F|nr:hypothetical protein [Klebsiella variicola]SXG85871.1 phage EaA protein [Klebsiella variicola]
MTTDITELAQREKFDAWWEREYKHLESSKYTDAVPHIKYGFWMAYQAGGAELVEALEKAQQVDEELCKLLPPGAEYMDPPDGGDITPLEGVRRMVADCRQRIAELESRTVKLPKKNIGWDRDEEDCWNNAIDACAEVLAAAGIKVEAE